MNDDFMMTPAKKKPRGPRESKIEHAHRKGRVAAAGGISLKWVSPGCVGVPDQIELYGVDRMVDALSAEGVMVTRATACRALASAIQFTEYKRQGEKPKPHQAAFHDRVLRARGFTVHIIDEI